jgi:hypothetical protein
VYDNQKHEASVNELKELLTVKVRLLVIVVVVVQG